MLLLDAAARRLDRGAPRGAHLHAAHGERARHLAVREELRRPLRRADQPCLRERLARDLRARRELPEVTEAHDLVLHPERVREPPLRQPPRERHLAALEAWLPAAVPVVTAARLDALVPLARRLAGTGAGAAPEALARAVRERRAVQVVQAELLGLALLLSGLRHG